MRRDSYREIAAFSLLGLSAFLLVCLFTQDVRDYLEGTGPITNACGLLGAEVGYHLIVWVGKSGAYGISLLAGVLGLVLFFRRSIQQWGWKLAGGMLMVLTLSALEVAISWESGSPDTLPGGYFGQFFHFFLLDNISAFGTYLLLALATLVAFIISTDTVFYPAFARTHGALFSPARLQALAALARERLPRPRLPRLPRLRFPRLPRLPRLAFPERAPLRAPGPPASARASEPGAVRGAGGADEAPERPDRAAAPPAAGGGPEAGDEGQAPSPDEPGGDSGPASFTIHLPEPLSPARKKPAAARPSGPYRLPPLTLLEPSPEPSNQVDRTLLEQTAAKIEETLRHFKIEARVVEVQKGPTITQFELTLAAGIKVHKIVNLADDLAMALKAQSIRIVAPIPGKSTVGIEVPNKNRNMVGLRELLEVTQAHDESYKLPLALGRGTAGAPVIGDLGEMPHLLIAGSTGSGKSVCINSIIVDILLTRTPDEVKLILVDPKMVELAPFENIPHLLCPVVTDMKKAPAVLTWLVDKMDERYELLAMAGVRHIASYNALGRAKLHERLAGKVEEEALEEIPESLPSVVVIIDELADLMMTSSKEVEASITRLSQKSRAVGIHVILATQRPSVDVITGLIKANMPSRISFRVASRVDSRTILDRNGAEKLLGKGDMLYLPPGTSEVIRVQGTFISDKEIREVVKYASLEAQPQFNSELTRFGVDGAVSGADEDELYDQAVQIVLGSQRGSVTLLQRQLQIGYTRASRLMEIMHQNGLVGPFKGSKAREVYYTLEDWEKSRARNKEKLDGGED
jgi:S-DNA-T family DNA segregation ATPase FtsK/SpoIIIE